MLSAVDECAARGWLHRTTAPASGRGRWGWSLNGPNRLLRSGVSQSGWGPAPTLSEKDLLRLEEYAEGGTLVIRAEMPGIDPEKHIDNLNARRDVAHQG